MHGMYVKETLYGWDANRLPKMHLHTYLYYNMREVELFTVDSLVNQKYYMLQTNNVMSSIKKITLNNTFSTVRA